MAKLKYKVGDKVYYKDPFGWVPGVVTRLTDYRGYPYEVRVYYENGGIGLHDVMGTELKERK